MGEKEVIISNFKEFYELAEFAFRSKKYNGAVTLYYKALVEICDLALLKSINRIGTNHSERFLLLEQHVPNLYSVASKLFRFYRDSYSKETSETIAKSVRENVQEAKRIFFDKEMGKEQ